MSTIPGSLSQEPQYAWEVATLFPEQGAWSEEDYLDLTDGTNRRVELVCGKLEFLPMPTEMHQAFVAFLYHALFQFVTERNLGKVYFSGIRVRTRPARIRQPDVLFLHKNHFELRHNRVWDGADLVMEVVSDDVKDRRRDYEEKVVEYAQANIDEYWIVDPQRQVVIVHRLSEGGYVVQGEFTPGQLAKSVLLEGFTIDVTALFAAAHNIPE